MKVKIASPIDHGKRNSANSTQFQPSGELDSEEAPKTQSLE